METSGTRVVVPNEYTLTVYSYGGEPMEGVADDRTWYVAIKTSHPYPLVMEAHCRWTT